MTENKKNYSRIMTSSSLIGGAQGLNIIISMIRVKFVAVFIGPIGVGLIATFQSILQITGTIASLGLQSSAVRDIAKSTSDGDEEQLARTVLSLKRLCWLTGSMGSAIVIIFSKKISEITFNNHDYMIDISILGLGVLFATLKSEKVALIQGKRQISDLAKLNIIGPICGTIISVLFYWKLGVEGIVPAIVLFSITEFLAAWWFAKKISVNKTSMSWFESFKEVNGMVKLGLAFMWSTLLIAIVSYFTRVLIANEIDLVAVGIFSAAFALSGMLVNFVLSAMAADYYPSLVAINTDHARMRELVNQQTEIGILLATPGLLATLTFSPWIIELFYTNEFSQAEVLLRWFILGCLGRVVSWPLGYILLAKGYSKLLVFTESTINVIHLLLIIFLLNWFEIEGVAIAYPILYLIHIIIMLLVSKSLIDMEWTNNVLVLLGVTISTTVLTFVVSFLLPIFSATIIALIITFAFSLYSIKGLSHRVGVEHRLIQLICKFPLIKKIINSN